MLRDLLSVVVFSHERLSQLEVATRSALEADSDCAILIVDDASKSREMLRGLARLEQHERISVYRRRTLLRRWNQRGGFYSNIRFALHEVQTPFALLMEDDQQIVRPLDRAEFEQITACLRALKSPFMGVTFAHNKAACLPAEGAFKGSLFVKSAQAAYSTNAVVHLARVREHRFRIGPSAQATDFAAAAYFGPHPVWPAPFLAYRPGDYGFRFGRAVGRPQAAEDANHSSYVELAAPEVARLKSMFSEVPTVTEFLSTRGSVELPTSSSLGGAKGRKPFFRRLWYFLTTRSYMVMMRLRFLAQRNDGGDLTVLSTSSAAQPREADVA